MKFLFFLLISAISILAQNKVIIDSKSEKAMLIGECNLDAFQDSSFAWWYNSEFENYEPNPDILNTLKQNLDEYKIEIILGSWCSDSRREVPRFIKILDLLDYDPSQIEIIAVDREKSAPELDIESKGIELVPTFIFVKDGKEMGRIIETPLKTLEEDILEIIKN